MKKNSDVYILILISVSIIFYLKLGNPINFYRSKNVVNDYISNKYSSDMYIAKTYYNGSGKYTMAVQSKHREEFYFLVDISDGKITADNYDEKISGK
ncbi:MAG: hypothetical protein SOR77_08965 [Peptoniphilus sp.]|uniref:YfjL-like protein n=1 Tax=Peptoniphilus sp. TaxID=1971214 RepID=UPI002A765D6C|nr:hypothetical protein [Peptoniphilus sp.]MDY2987748.1 hypothetical protein [Peptoniphilus sp.]